MSSLALKNRDDTQYPVDLRVHLKSVGRGRRVQNGTGFKTDWCSLGDITITTPSLQGLTWAPGLQHPQNPATAQLTQNVRSNYMIPGSWKFTKDKVREKLWSLFLSVPSGPVS